MRVCLGFIAGECLFAQTPVPDCLSIRPGRPAKTAGGPSSVIFQNMCEEPVTAFVVGFKPGIEGAPETVFVETIGRNRFADQFRLSLAAWANRFAIGTRGGLGVEWPTSTPEGQAPSGLTILAVVFADTSTSGDPALVRRIFADRAAALNGFRRIRETLDVVKEFPAAKRHLLNRAELRRATGKASKSISDQLYYQFCEQATGVVEADSELVWQTFATKATNTVQAIIAILSANVPFKIPPPPAN